MPARLTFVNTTLWLKGVAIRMVRFLLFAPGSSRVKKILLFRTGSIGDNICALPAIAAIRKHFNTSQLDILTNAGGKNLVSLQHLLARSEYDNIIDYHGSSRSELFSKIRAAGYDLVIELPQDQASLLSQLRNMVFFRFAGIRSGFGWEVNTSYSFRQTQEKHLQFISERDRLLGILRKQGIECSEMSFPLEIADDDTVQVTDMLKETMAKKIVAIVPGAKRSQNRYPFNRFVELAAWLVDKDYQVVVVGGPEDEQMGRKLSEANGIVSYCGKLSPVQSAVLLAKCNITISNDTGPMHLSYAVGTPVIGLFSSRDFQEKWFPPKPNIALRNYNVHCSLCFSETCGNNICMQGIPLDAVKNAFLELESRLK